MNKNNYGVIFKKSFSLNEKDWVVEGHSFGREYFEFCQNTVIPFLKQYYPDGIFKIVRVVPYDESVK